tara:strand:+ start:173 stop:481 length:309 start_codon:yes stop_codon:yes gene_type:complete
MNIIHFGSNYKEIILNTPYTHIVQAWGTEIGWVDCCKAVSYQHAMFKEGQLKEGDNWLPKYKRSVMSDASTLAPDLMFPTKARRTRIVPISEANCEYNKDST